MGATGPWLDTASLELASSPLVSVKQKWRPFYVFRDLPKFRILEVRLEGPSILTRVHSSSPPLKERLCLWKGFDLRDLSNLHGANKHPS